MESEFLNYSQSIALKELGFDEPCLGYYTIYSDGEVKLYTSDGGFRNLEAPLKQQALKFFRDKHSLCGSVDSMDDGTFTFSICDIPFTQFIWPIYPEEFEYFKTWEEAELSCIRKLIYIVRTRISFF